MLQELSIRVYRDERRPSFQFFTGGVEQLYLLYMGKVDLGSIRILNVYFTNQEHNVVDRHDTILNINVPFDFFEFELIESNFLKKRMLLDTLHWGIIKLALELGWELHPFKKSFEKCIECELNYSWFFRGKKFKSPDKNYHFGMWHLVDIGKYEVWEILFDNNKTELIRRLAFKDSVSTFFIDYASWEGQNTHFYYRFNGPKMKFVVSLKDLLAGHQVEVPESSRNFFKG